MPKTHAIQEGFTAGEVTPLIHGRVSSDIYKESVALMQNMVATIHGPAIRRPGTRYIVDAKYQTAAKHRLVPFAVGNSPGNCVLHVGPDTIQAYNAIGKIQTVSQIINNPSFQLGLTGWTERSYWYDLSPGYYYPSATFCGSGCHGRVVHDPLELSAEFEADFSAAPSSSSLQWNHAALAQKITLQPSTLYDFSWASLANAIAPTAPNRVFGKIRVVEVTDPNNYFPTGTTDSYVTNVLKSFDWKPDGAQSGSDSFTTPAWGAPKDVWVEVISEGAQSVTTPPYESLVDQELFFVSLTQGAPVDVEFASPWAGLDISKLSWVQIPGTNPALILVHPEVTPRQLTYDIATDTWALTTPAFTAAPADWVAGKQPSVVGIHDGRLVLANNATRPERVWLSKVNEYFNFTTGSNPNDSFSFDMNEAGQIMWLTSLNTLVVGAASGVWDFVSLNGAPIGPGNVRGRKHDSNAPTINRFHKDDDGISYIGPSGGRVYYLNPEKTSDTRYQISEQSFLGRHIVSSAVSNISGVKYPHSIAFLPMANSFVSSSRDKLLEYSSWHKHICAGTVYDVVSVQGQNHETFALISFERTSGSKVCVVKLDWGYPLDNNKIVGQASSTTVSGLSHLEGQSVYVWANGKSLGPYTVSSGSITLSEATTIAVVGLAYSSRLVTNRLSRGDMPQSGLKRWNKPSVRVGEGQRPKIFGFRPKEALPGNPSLPHASTEDLEITHAGWNRFGHVDIEEDSAAPLTVYAIHGQLASENV